MKVLWLSIVGHLTEISDFEKKLVVILILYSEVLISEIVRNYVFKKSGEY